MQFFRFFLMYQDLKTDIPFHCKAGDNSQYRIRFTYKYNTLDPLLLWTLEHSGGGNIS